MVKTGKYISFLYHIKEISSVPIGDKIGAELREYQDHIKYIGLRHNLIINFHFLQLSLSLSAGLGLGTWQELIHQLEQEMQVFFYA